MLEISSIAGSEVGGLGGRSRLWPICQAGVFTLTIAVRSREGLGSAGRYVGRCSGQGVNTKIGRSCLLAGVSQGMTWDLFDNVKASTGREIGRGATSGSATELGCAGTGTSTVPTFPTATAGTSSGDGEVCARRSLYGSDKKGKKMKSRKSWSVTYKYDGSTRWWEASGCTDQVCTAVLWEIQS